MATSAELEREIAATRQRLQADVLLLRRRASRAALVGLAVGAVALLVIGGVVAWRLSRPPTWRERLRRVVPARARLRIPPMRLYVGKERMLGEDPDARESLALRAAEALGRAAAAAVVGLIWERIFSRNRE